MSTEPASVLVLLVAANGEPWLPDVIAGLRKQTWDELSVLAVDNASTDRSRALLVKAFGAKNVVSLERRVGYGRALAAALKVASERAPMADAFLLLHDDAAMGPESVEAMVEALARDRVGIVGAKLVEWDDPDLLQEVGLTTDRFGRLFNPLERGEVDQGQHDGLKEVFFSSSACLLVSREVLERVGLFDLRYVALRDDFDLGWRARLAGFRSVVTSRARVRHAVASYRDLRPGPVSGRSRYFGERNMIASLIKNYSIRSLVVALPVTLFVSLLNVVLFLFTGRRRAARQTLAALQWNVVHLPSTLRARARAQHRRRVPDREVVKLMVRGAPRVRDYVERALEQVVGEPAEGVEQTEGLALDARPRKRLRDRVRAHPVGIAVVLLAAAYLIGVRGLFGSGGLAGADLAPFPGSGGDFFREFFSGWRSAGTGGAAPASPALPIAGALSILAFGSARLAERILFLALVPLAAASAWRLAGALELPARAKRVSALAYALSPLALAAFSQGRLPDLVLVAALPALLVPGLRAAGFAPDAGWRSVASGALGLAAVASFSPWVLPGVAGAYVLVAGAAALTGGAARAGRTIATGAGLAAAATALLMPWSVELFRSGSPIGAHPGPLGAGAIDLIRLTPHAPGAIPSPLAWAFPGAAAAGVLLALPERERLARALTLAGAAAVLVAWAVARGVPWIAPRPGLPLTLAAACGALLVGLAAEGFVPFLRVRSFGFGHVLTGALAGFGVAALVVAVGFVGRGSFDGLERSGELVPAFFVSEQRQLGEFRVLWLAGDRRSLRADLSGPQGETMLTYGTRRAGGGERSLESALAAVLAGRTEQAGRLLAPLGVRYVVLRVGTDPSVARAFERQTDVRFAQRFRGARVLANQAWLPIGAAVASPEWIAASKAPSDDAAAAVSGVPADPGRAGTLRRLAPGQLGGTVAPEARAVLLADEFSGRWRAFVRGRPVAAGRSFGWATSFALPEGVAGGPVLASWRGQGRHRAALLAEALLLIGVAAAWSRRTARERGER